MKSRSTYLYLFSLRTTRYFALNKLMINTVTCSSRVTFNQKFYRCQCFSFYWFSKPEFGKFTNGTAVIWGLKLLHVWEYEKNSNFFVRMSKKMLLHYWKCWISWEIYKFATFSINNVKLKLFNHLLQSQLIVAVVLVSLNCLHLTRIFSFLDLL